MNKTIGGWLFSLSGGLVTLFILVSSFNDGDWNWVTDLGRFPKYLLAGPLTLTAGLMVLRDVYGSGGPRAGR
jgi:hypothetical protein